MSKAEMILYSPVRYFLCIIVVQTVEEPFFMGYLCFFILEQPFSIEFFLLSV